MTHRPRITDESVFMKWMSMEIGKINEGIVSNRKLLSELLAEDIPTATTKKGEAYYFKKPIIAMLGEKVPSWLQERLKLPIIFFFSPGVPDSCCLADEWAVKVLQHLGEISSLRAMPDGRCWVARAIVFAIMQKYPTAVQVAVGL